MGNRDQNGRSVEQVRDTLAQLDPLLANDRLGRGGVADLTDLRRQVKKMLVSMNANLAALADIKEQDTFGTDPSLANQRYKIVQKLEETKIDFEFEILPAIERITSEVMEQARQNPEQFVNEEALRAAPPGKTWTPRALLETAEEFVEDAGKAVEIGARAYGLLKGLGLVLGIPLP